MSDPINSVSAQVQPQVIKIKIADLKPHPQEAHTFFGPPSPTVRSLADGMAVSGPQYAIEILPNYTIVSDHDPVRAAMFLRWAEIDAVLRPDLADNGDAAVEDYVLFSRLNRRGRHRLEVARDYQRLHEIGQHEWRKGRRRRDDLHECQRRNLHDLMAEKLGAKGRSLNRWLAVLQAPVEVQDALIREQISLVDAEAVGHLRPKVKEEIAQAIRDGGNVKDVVVAHLPQKDGRHKSAHDAFSALLRSIKRGVQDLDGREDQIPGLDEKEFEEFGDAVAFLQRLGQGLHKLDLNPLKAIGLALAMAGPSRGRRKVKKIPAVDSVQLA